MEKKLKLMSWLTASDVQRFLASEELWYDPMYQSGMDQAYHHFLDPKWDNSKFRKEMRGEK